MADVVYVQGSVAEDVAIKRDVSSSVTAAAPANTNHASSTSALPGSDFLGHVPHTEHCLVTLPVNPPSLIPLVEICPTRWTAQSTIGAVRQFLSAAGMMPVTLRKEIGAFLVNRLQYTLVAEALHLVGEGYCSSEDVDGVMNDGLALRRASIGPFEVAHLNSAQGFQEFVDRLGGMMRKIGRDARTDYDWSVELVACVHDSLTAHAPQGHSRVAVLAGSAHHCDAAASTGLT